MVTVTSIGCFSLYRSCYCTMGSAEKNIKHFSMFIIRHTTPYFSRRHNYLTDFSPEFFKILLTKAIRGCIIKGTKAERNLPAGESQRGSASAVSGFVTMAGYFYRRSTGQTVSRPCRAQEMARRIPTLYGWEVSTLPNELKIRVEPWEFSHPEGMILFYCAPGVFVGRGQERNCHVQNQI